MQFIPGGPESPNGVRAGPQCGLRAGHHKLCILAEMEKKIMVIKIIGLVIGVLILAAGIYYLAKEKHDPESRKIYTVVSVAGGLIAAVCVLLLVL